MRYRIFIIIVLLTAVTAVTGTRLDGAEQDELKERIGSKESELDRLRREIRQQRQKIEDLRKKEKDIGTYLERLRRERALTRELLDGIEEKKKMLEEQVAELRLSLENNEDVYTRRLKLFSGRMRKMYKDGPRDFWKEILDADDFSELVQKYKFFVLVAAEDAALVEEIRNKKEEISSEEAEITKMLYEVTVSENEKKTELSRLERNRREREKALSGLKSEEASRQRKLDELAEAEANMLDIIAELERRRDKYLKSEGDYGEEDFPALKGRMPRPVEGATERKFGKSRHPEYGTVTFNSGIDIRAREGSPIRAVARGRVEYGGSLSGYGNCIIINHGAGYYSLYARIGSIFVTPGDQVESGDVIAEVPSGASSKTDSFHFEIRESKTALDPEEWIK